MTNVFRHQKEKEYSIKVVIQIKINEIAVLGIFIE